MKTRLDIQRVLTFLRRLRENNNREWFQANRDDFDTARADFEDYILHLKAQTD